MMRTAIAVAVLASGWAFGGEPGPVRDTIRVGQMAGVPVKWDLEANFAVFLQRLAEADAENADIFITPECWLDGYAAPDPESTREKLRGVAQGLHSSPYLQRVAQEARDRAMWICFGFTSLEGERIFNSAGLWNDQGELVGVYHKTHIQTHDHQFDYGEALSTFDSPWGPLGIVICADRRWPESIRTLRMQGARLILNPTYGFHGDMNTAIIRTRSFENQCFIAFTHPEESLVTGHKGAVLTQKVGNAGWAKVTELDLSLSQWDNHLPDRRPELYGKVALGLSPITDRKPEGDKLRVAVGQITSGFDVAANAAKIVDYMERAHGQGARVIVFPEMALAGYSKKAAFMDQLDWAAVDAGLASIGEACARLGMYAVVGAPTREGDQAFCSAVAIGPEGTVVDVFEKVYRAGEQWASPGRKLGTFAIDGTQAGSFVCHDERYGPLVQLRALSGTQLFFYISCESGPYDMHKINPYRAQIQARAAENGVFVIHANTPAMPYGTEGLADTSHGESRIIDPNGNILAEAPMYGDALLVTDIVPSDARDGGLGAALTEGPLAAWMREGVDLVRQH